MYIKISKNTSAKYYQENKERLQKKKKVLNITKTFQKMKKKSLLSIEKKFYRMRKNAV